MMDSSAPVTQIDLLVFEVGGQRFGADLSQVRRIDQDSAADTVGRPLGTPRSGKRALVFEVSLGNERRLAVDHVQGVAKVPVASLRRLPRAVHSAPYAIGAWLDGDVVILLVDLFAMVPTA